MKFPEHFTTVDKLNYLERMVLLHSIIYYDLNENVISDVHYNKIAKLLAKKVKQYRDKPIFKKTMYAYVFKDYTDGSTGFDLAHKLKTQDYNYLELIATHIIKQYKEENL